MRASFSRPITAAYDAKSEKTGSGNVDDDADDFEDSYVDEVLITQLAELLDDHVSDSILCTAATTSMISTANNISCCVA